jgi:SAM-dependent methyltransferase
MGRLVASTPAGVNETFWRLLLDEPLAGATVVDVGTGTGRIALALAPLCRRVVGIERDPALAEEARRRAAAGGIGNVEFALADADALGDFRQIDGVIVEPEVITAHLFLSDRLVENAARTLRAGRALVLLGFHVDHWRETGRCSRFAYDEERLRGLLARHGFVVEHLTVETEVQEFHSLEEALAGAVALEDRWRADGRWFRYIRFLEDGGRTLTRSLVVARARRS